MKKLAFLLMLAAVLTGTTLAAPLDKYQIRFVDEFLRPVDMGTSVSIYIYEAGTTTEISTFLDRNGNSAVTQPITDDSTNTPLSYSTGFMEWYMDKNKFKLNVTDGTSSRDFDNLTSGNVSIMWPSFLTQLSSTSYGQTDDIDFTFAGWIVDGDTAGRLDMIPDSDGGEWAVGDGTAQSDVYIYASSMDYIFYDESLALLNMVDIDLEMDDDASLFFGSDQDISVKYDNSGDDLDVLGDDSELALGADGAGMDVYWHTETAGDNVLFDEDNTEIYFTDVDIQLDDASLLYLGTGGDATLQFDGTNLELFALAADTPFAVGSTSAGFDLTYYFETAGQFRSDYDGDFINLTDDMDLRFGTGASSDGDFQISSNSSNVLTIGQVVGGTGTMAIGADGTGIDTVFYSDTAGDNVTWDQDGSTNGALVFEDSIAHFMDDTTVVFGDGSDGTLQYDEDGENAMQWNNVAVYGSLRLVEVVTTASNTLTAAESGKVLVSSYTGTQTHTLPDAAAGLYYTFNDNSATAADDVVVDCQAGDNINGDTNGDAIESVTDAIGQTITLLAIDGTRWITLAEDGTWGQQ